MCCMGRSDATLTMGPRVLKSCPICTADGLFAGKCSRVEHRDKCSLQPHQFCLVAAAGVQNQHLLLTMGRGPIHLGRGHQPIQRYCTSGLIPGCT